MSTLKPWKRERYLEWRRAYEKTDKYREKVRAYQAKRRANPALKGKFAQYQRNYKERNKLRFLVYLALKRSERRGIEADKEYLRSLIGSRPPLCACCLSPLDYGGIGRGNQAPYRAPSLDRINTSQGYIRGNVGIICWRCNVLKKDGSLDEIEAIARYMRKGGM